MYQHLGDRAIERLTAIYKASLLLLGHTPTGWRNAKVIFIPKPGKDNYTLPRSFRPITLSNVMLKVMERVVQRDLEDTCFQAGSSPHTTNTPSEWGAELILLSHNSLTRWREL